MVVTKDTPSTFVFELTKVAGTVNSVRHAISFNPRIALFKGTVPAVKQRTGHGQS